RRQPVTGKPKVPSSAASASPSPPSSSAPKSDKLSYKDQRDYELLPARIEELEAAITKGEAILADPDLFTADPQRFATISKGVENARAEKDAAEERWLDLAERVEG
ncbi:MAG: ABC transporter C-terminal domain-containing protein, partial [Pseudomonadota bacterium]